jgi:hypothetical protein
MVPHAHPGREWPHTPYVTGEMFGSMFKGQEEPPTPAPAEEEPEPEDEPIE